MNKGNINMIGKWVLISVLTPFVLILLLSIAIYLPPVQNFLVHKAANYISQKTGMDVSVDHVCLVFPLDLGVDGVKIIQQNDSLPQVKDTIADINRIVVDVQLFPLFKKNIEIDQFNIYDMKVNTADFIHQARIKGSLSTLEIKSHGIDLNKSSILLNNAYIDKADIDIALSDTVPEDTTEAETPWLIQLEELTINNSNIALHTPNDTLSITSHIDALSAKNGTFDIKTAVYSLEELRVHNSLISYDNVYQAHVKGFDPNHLSFEKINLGMRNLYFAENKIEGIITEGALTEKSGIGINSITADFIKSEKTLKLNADISTLNEESNPSSTLCIKTTVDLNVLDSLNPGKIDASIKGNISKSDMILALGESVPSLRKQWPEKPLSINAKVNGNLQLTEIKELDVTLPTAFNVKAKGYVYNLNDISQLKTNLQIDAKTNDLSFAKAFLDKESQRLINLPPLLAHADVKSNKNNYDISFQVREGKGILNGNAEYNTNTLAYDANIKANSIQLNHFIKGYNLGRFTGESSIKGRGFDFQSSATKLLANAKIKELHYDGWNINNVSFDAEIKNGQASGNFIAHNDIIDGEAYINALLNKSLITASLTAQLTNFDIERLHLSDAPLNISGNTILDISTDLNDFYKVVGSVSNLSIKDSASIYHPDDMTLDVLTRKDTIHANVNCGDFTINADTRGGYKSIIAQADNIMNEAKRQFNERIIDEEAIQRLLPEGHVFISAGQGNPIYRISNKFGYSFSNIYTDFSSSPALGLNGTIKIDSLRTSDIQIDHTDLSLVSDTEKTKYNLTVQNGKDNPQYAFLANINGTIEPNGLSLWAGIDDEDGKRGIELALAALMERNGIRINLNDSKQILGYKSFAVNPDNYIFLSDDKRVSANLKLLSDDGAGIQVYTDDENADALQDITVSLNRFDIEKVLDVLPYMPSIKGTLNGDFHAIVTPEDLSVSSSVAINNFTYENCYIGNISSEFVYVPQNDGIHHIDGIIFNNDIEIGTIIGDYDTAGEGRIDANLSMTDFPLDAINGFIPDQIIGLTGTGEGSIAFKGALSALDIDGEIFLQNAKLISVPYGVAMRFDDDPVRITNSRLLLENFQMYANNDQPLLCYGYIDISDTDHIFTNLKMRTYNFQLIDSKETRRSEVYGKAFINGNATMTGDLDNLQVTGQIDVLPTTDIYYILKDSPISTDNRLKELVTFTDLSSDEPLKVIRPTVDGLNVNMKINVAEGSHIECWLNENHTNYLDMFTSGDLNLVMKGNDMKLVGKCTITEGEMKYSLPIIPLKTFTIEKGSYIEFTGNVMDPRLNITAEEENRATVNVNGINQTVLFNCGVKLTKTLNDMGVEFTIDAPENETIGDELKTKSIEERGKLAVTMLTTGMYLTEDNTSNFTMNSALSSFLQQEINQVAGNALRTLDLSVGLENSTDANGHMHTDYSFKFAKRFWNNRLSISVGGKISTGPDVSNQNQSFFDNVELQYRLSDLSNQYLQLFYKRAVYDNLEGYVGQYGGGYMWKRKLQSLQELFKGSETKKHWERTDSTTTHHYEH